jgi:hypothetical protein
MTMSTFCSPLEEILRFDFADFNEDSDIEEMVILLLGEAINFLLQLPMQNFQARVVKIKFLQIVYSRPFRGYDLASLLIIHCTHLRKVRGLLPQERACLQYERSSFRPIFFTLE